MFGGGRAYVVVQERPWLDPGLDALADQLDDRRVPAGSKVEAALAELARARTHPERRVQVAVAAGKRLAGAEAELRARARTPVGDAAADGDALALLAETLLQKAWAVRGQGRVATVKKDAWAVFHSMLEEADEIGRAALDLVPGDAVAATTRLNIGRGLGLPDDEWWARLEEARKQEPFLYPAHLQMLQALCAKWYGSHEIMFAFARQVAREAPAGSPVGVVLAIAHLEYWATENRYAVPDADRALLIDAAGRWVAGGEPALAHPQAPGAHQMFAWLLRDDLPRVNFHLTRARGRMDFFPWAYLGDGDRPFRKLMARAGVRY